MIVVAKPQVPASLDDGRLIEDDWYDTTAALAFGDLAGTRQSLWLRFTNIDVPQGKKIRAAYLYYKAAATRADNVSTNIQAEDVDDATRVTGQVDYDGRSLTTASVAWDNPEAFTAETWYLSPDISSVIQEVIDRQGWRRGNSIGIFHQNDASGADLYRTVYSYDNGAADAPILFIEYEGGPRFATAVTLHADGGRMLAEVLTAHRIDRVFAVSGKAPFSFNIASNDGQANGDTIREGRIVVISSTTGLPPYVGSIDRIEEDPDTRTVEVSGDSLEAILYGRQLPLDATFEGQSAGSIARQMLALVNSTNPTGIWASTRSEPGTPIRGTFDASGSMLGNALDDLAERTGDEWWLEHVVERGRIENFLRWGKRGVDKSMSIHLQEGVHFSRAEYVRDALGLVQSVAVIGGGAAVADRSAAVISSSRPSGYTERGTVRESASEAHRRSLAVRGPALSREIVEYLPLDQDEAVLADAAARALEEPLTAAEELDLTINAVLDWGDFGPGDVVRAVLPNVGFGGVSRRVRVLAMQPDEDAGECDLAVRVVRDD